MAVEIPTTHDFPDYRQAVVLGGTLYRLRFTYNGRSDSWHLEVADASGAVLRTGLRLRTDWPALAQHVDGRLPDGLLVPFRLDGTRLEPGRRDFPELCALVFAPRSELPAPE